MADQDEISGCADRSLHAHGRSGGACHLPEQSRAEHPTPSSSVTPTAPNQSGPVQELYPFSTHVCSTSMVRALLHITEEEDPSPQNIALLMIVGAGRYVLNDVIVRDVCIETVEEFIQRIARRMYDIADQGPHEFLRNIAQMPERSPSGRPLPGELLKTPPSKE
ncbi:hypothetical protein EVAR_51642_1 [Eumeta japonica]|uniref:Uncharacterized protein n=1 Tax=Eumeta variegata TaxID=151549 RepID=A0A4C1YGX8_EUMVA|nr:hypothetical protein EVAR_51642_1 [Eumeta japonica]